MNCLHISDGVSFSHLISIQEHNTRLQKVLPYMLGYEKNAARFYICSLFPCLHIVISKYLLSDDSLKYSECFPLAVLVLFEISKSMSMVSELGRITTNEGSGFVVH